MSTKSNAQGRSYEYAWMITFNRILSKIRQIRIIKNSSYLANEKAWQTIDESTQNILLISAESAIHQVFKLEPNLAELTDELILEAQDDKKGILGDVRDLVIKCCKTDWEIGFSIKHNHDDAKHSRLSHNLDFGEHWYKTPCSQEYKNAVKPVFDQLCQYKLHNKRWSDLPNKEGDVYIPILTAFIDEIYRAYAKKQSLPHDLLEYLIEIEDYYKIVSCDNKRIMLIFTFNVRGKLNKPSKNKIATSLIPLVELPTELVALHFKKDSKNTVEMYLNNGWQINFRIHNASSKVQPSLKFAIHFQKMPNTVAQFGCAWKNP